jgi:LPS export ABC transporter protein LptC
MLRRFAAVALAAVLSAGCRKDAPPPTATTAEVTASQVMYNLHQRITKLGVLKVDLHGDTATTMPNNPHVDLKGVRLKFYDENGALAGNVTSRAGEYDTNTSAMIARGNVLMILNGPQGKRTIRTDELHYDQRGDKVWSDKPTTMIENGQTYHGTSFTSNTGFTNLTVQNLTTSGVNPNGSGGGIRF